MNMYGTLAASHWKKADPARYDELENPTEYFEQLGERVLARVNDLAIQMEQNPPTDEEYLQTVGRLNAIREQAEEIAMSELALIKAVRRRSRRNRNCRSRSAHRRSG
jgi:hypothetical protein